MTAPATSTCDWLQDRRVSWAWPAAFILVAVSWLVIPDPAGALLAATGFGVAGGLCVGNARHCSRTHCLITGPLYLLGAMLFLARLVGVDVPSGLVVGAAVVGTILAFVPEWVGTRYVGPTTDKSVMATTGTLFAAGLVAACCLGPTLFVLFGVSVAALGTLGALAPYRLLFLGGGLGCWLFAYQYRRRARRAGDACLTPASRRGSGALLWGSLLALLLAAVYPYAVAHLTTG
jgi:mercuric ion transport protein